MTDFSPFSELDDRARRVFTTIVEGYLRDGEPISSRHISADFGVSPATIRNVMADLEAIGLLRSPHTSAGRMPSEIGLRYFVDGLLVSAPLAGEEKAALEEQYREIGQSPAAFLARTGRILSDISACAGLVVAPRRDKPLHHIEFRKLNETQALAVMVQADGHVENRLIAIPAGTTPDMLMKAGHFLSERLHGSSVGQMRARLTQEIKERRHELGEITAALIESGLAVPLDNGSFIVRGTSNLLSAEALKDLERVRMLMQQLESHETAEKLLNEAGQADGVKIFIGAENPVFQESGYSLILAPYRDAQRHIVGALGVIGPTRLDYARIIPSVNAITEILSRHLISSTQ